VRVSRNPGPPPRLSEAELPAITPPEIIGVRDADGQRGLDLRDGEYERVYSLPDQYTRLMFIALGRQEGVLVYRRPRQRNETLCVKTTAWKHRDLEQRFEELSALLDGEIVTVLQRFLAEDIEESGL
jgi:hypothetical protein